MIHNIQNNTTGAENGNEFLAFTLGKEEYGIDIPVSYTHLRAHET